MIQISDLTKVYASKDFSHHALKGINLTIEDSDIFAILGSSGAGKSTFIRCLNRLEEPTSGSIVVDGFDVVKASAQELLSLRSKMSMIFQNFCLFQQKTVLDNILFPLTLTKKIDENDRAFALDLLDRVGLSEYENRYPCQLSGGQAQRVAIARALIVKPSYLLCDEATSALDRATTSSILHLLKQVNKDLGITLVIITHSLDVARAISNKVAVFHLGEVVEQGYTSQVLFNPTTPEAKALIANHEVIA